jgi:hypothetical protein
MKHGLARSCGTSELSRRSDNCSRVGRPAEGRWAMPAKARRVFLEATSRCRERLGRVTRSSIPRLARLRFTVATMGAAVLVAAGARAEPGSEVAAPGPAVAAGAACAPVPAELENGAPRVDALFQRFQCLFDAQAYQDCLPVLEQACSLTDSPRCLFNLALVHHALLHCEAAVGYYEAYLERDPYDAGRDEALSALADLRGICGKHEPAPLLPPASVGAIPPVQGAVPAPAAAVEPVPTAAVPDGMSTRRVLAYTTLAAGAATSVATAVFAVYGKRAESDVVERAAQNEQVRDAEAAAIDSNGHQYNTLAWIFLGSSVALLGTSVTLFVIDANAQQSVSVGAEGFASVRYQGRF